MQYQGLSLCTGILGFELGMQLAGLSQHISIRQCVEINPYCQQLIQLRLPGVPVWDDLITYQPPDDFEPDRTIVWSGFPCQPVSQAGKQRGDEDKRYLWPHILRLIRQIRPVVWLGENVDGLRTIDAGRLFGTILEGLAQSGYCVEWSCVSASEVGAVHKRERVWLIAYRPEAIANTQGWQLPIQQNQWSYGTSPKAWSNPAPIGSSAELAYSSSQGYQGGIGEGVSRAGWKSESSNVFGQFTYANSTRLERGGQTGWVASGNGSDWIAVQNAQSVLCGSDDGIPVGVAGYLLRHGNLEQWLTASTIPTFTRLSSAETRSLSPEDRQEYKRLLAEYHQTKKQYEQWLEALGNAICPHQAAIAWHRVGQILGLQ